MSFVFVRNSAMSENRASLGLISHTENLRIILYQVFMNGLIKKVYIHVKVSPSVLYEIATKWLMSDSLASNKNFAVHTLGFSWHCTNLSLKPRFNWIFCARALNCSLFWTNVTLHTFFRAESRTKMCESMWLNQFDWDYLPSFKSRLVCVNCSSSSFNVPNSLCIASFLLCIL